MDVWKETIQQELTNRNIQLIAMLYQTNLCRVYRATDGKRNGQEVAVKLITLNARADGNRVEQEAKLQEEFQHENVVALYDHFWLQAAADIWIFAIESELMQSDVRKDILCRKQNSYAYKEAELLDFLYTIARTLCAAQQRNLAHRDIKPHNIFLSQGVYKIGDFGSATHFLAEYSNISVVGTPLYLSPKLTLALISQNQTVEHNPYKSDVYSLGLTVLNMALLEATRDANAVQNIPYSEFLKRVLRWMLMEQEADRPDFISLFGYLEAVRTDQQSVHVPRASIDDMESVSMIDQAMSIVSHTKILPEPQFGILPPARFVPEPQFGVLPSARFVPESQFGVLPPAGFVPEPQFGILPPARFVSEPQPDPKPIVQCSQCKQLIFPNEESIPDDNGVDFTHWKCYPKDEKTKSGWSILLNSTEIVTAVGVAGLVLLHLSQG